MTRRAEPEPDEAVQDRLRSLEARTRDVHASRDLLLRLGGLVDGPPQHEGALSLAIVRFAVPSLVTAALASGALLVLDRTGDPSFDDEVALAATMEVGP